ncbi:MAG: hypothetical protein IH607_06990 [Firmicutes bacterium]|nr:hypothetical protein [Bacillota bacterium]
MCGWDESSGRITLTDAVSLRSGMPRKRVLDSLEALIGKPCETDDALHASMAASAAFSFLGAQAACVCSFSQGRLRTVELSFTGGTAAWQRETLFAFIGKRDPCPKRRQNVRIRCPFGAVWITADPRGGDASLRVSYAVKE